MTPDAVAFARYKEVSAGAGEMAVGEQMAVGEEDDVGAFRIIPLGGPDLML